MTFLASVYGVQSGKKFDNLQKITQNVYEIGRNPPLRWKDMEQSKTLAGKRLLCGGLVGAANSLFGGGGGMIAVPLLTKTGLREKTAHATAILVILPVSLFSFILYAIRGYYEPTVLVPTAIGVSVGGALGAKLLGKLPTKTVNLIFAALQLLAGAFLFFSKT